SRSRARRKARPARRRPRSRPLRTPQAGASPRLSRSRRTAQAPATDFRDAQGRPGRRGANRQGAARQKGRAHHQPRGPARALPGVYADDRPYRRFTQNRFGGKPLALAAAGQRSARELPGGFIVRTAAGGATDDEIRTDIEFLGKTWNEIKQKSEERKAPALLHRDLNLVERILRDYVSDDFTAIWIDNEEEYGKVVE